MASNVTVINNFSMAVAAINDNTEKFLAAACSAALARSRMYAPLAYGRLVNSQRTVINRSKLEIVGIIGYDVEYAEYLEGSPTSPAVWKPKPPPKYGNARRGISKSNAWNPNAKPGFLAKGVEDARPDFDQLRILFKV